MFRKILEFRSEREGDIIDITEPIRQVVKESRVKDGLVHLFVRHSTTALTAIEFEPGLLAPDSETCALDSRWGDGNGRSHVKAALVGPSLTVPVGNGELLCGIWQQLVLFELDVYAGRERTSVCTVTGD